MEPFPPDDPLWKLMGYGRPPAVRPNFTQNVLRAVRQGSQDLGWRVRLGEWWLANWQRPLVGGVAATVMIVVTSVVLFQPRPITHPLAGIAAVAAVATTPQVSDAEMASIADEDVNLPLASLDHMDALVAMEDTSKLTDTELQFLLY